MNKINFKKAAAIGICCTIITSGVASAMIKDTSVNEESPRLEIGIENRIIREDRGIGVQVNGHRLQLDVEPLIENSRTLIPLRGVMEGLGAKVEWNPEHKSIKVNTEEISIELVIGEDTAKIKRRISGELKEETLELEVPARIIGGRTFIPGRFITETLGATVAWDNANSVMIIKTVNNSNKDIISVERVIDFEIVEHQSINENQILSKWYQANYKKEGFHSMTDGEWKYVLVSAGEKSTGGYYVQIGSITEVTPGTAYIHGTLSSPDKDSFVTQALTYPSVLVRFHRQGIEKIQGDLVNPQQDLGNVVEDEISESLREMGKAISLDSVKEMKLYTLMGEEIKTFTSEEIKEIVNQLNTRPTYNGAYILMLAGNNIKITLGDGSNISLTSYGFKDHVIMSGVVDGKNISYCIVSPMIGSILLNPTEL